MTKPMITIHDVATGETLEREMNAAESKQYEADQLAAQARLEAEATKAAEKAALLARLGMTADEANLLLS